MVDLNSTHYSFKGLNMPFTFTPTEIPEVIVISPRVFQDSRGYFLETWKNSEFQANGITEDFVQENVSFSTKGVIRGLHYQIHPSAQGKLVSCVQGSILDVAVDIRQNSPTFGKWVGRELNAENREMMYVPVGFAHGFYTQSETALVVYKVTAEYDQPRERGIIWNDPTLNIDWGSSDAILSGKDEILPLLNEVELFE
jgi:dTDP-4-dehydrorhamnose 3,5-epimerase